MREAGTTESAVLAMIRPRHIPLGGLTGGFLEQLKHLERSGVLRPRESAGMKAGSINGSGDDAPTGHLQQRLDDQQSLDEPQDPPRTRREDIDDMARSRGVVRARQLNRVTEF
jgi:hypothetical protein